MPSSSLTISLVQTNLFWEDKVANLQQLEEKILGLKDKTELVVLPEMFTTGFSMNPQAWAEEMEGPTVEWMKRVSKERRVVLTGSFIAKEGDQFYNRLVWMLPNGQSGHYDKRHLFGFAGEDKHYSRGSRRLVASVKGWRILLLICYDLRFPVWSRQSTEHSEEVNNEPEYDLIIYVANWPERRNHAWKTLLQARAIENQCFVIGVNRVGNDGNQIYHSGDSMAVDPMGEILFSSAHEELIHTLKLEKGLLHEIRNRLPFLKDADRFLRLD